MSKRKMRLQPHRGQILIEALFASLLMIVIMVAFAKLIEKKRSSKMDYRNIQTKLEGLNASANEPAK